jgi:hypothetical protein
MAALKVLQYKFLRSGKKYCKWMLHAPKRNCTHETFFYMMGQARFTQLSELKAQTCAWRYRTIPKGIVLSTNIVIMVVMVALCAIRLGYTCLLVLVDLADAIEEGSIHVVAAYLEWWISSNIIIL